MPVASDTYKYIFFCSPLTGSTSVSRTLVDKTEGYWAPKSNIYDENKKVVVDRKHGTLNQLRKHNVLPKDKLDNYYKFAGIRNPFDRTVSEYHKMRKLAAMDDPPSFFDRDGDHAKWASENDFAQYARIRFRDREPFQIKYFYIKEMNRFVRTEHLQEDFELAAKEIGLPQGIEVYDINVTRGDRGHEYRDYYDDTAKKLVGDFFRQYLDHFGYTF